MFHGVSTILSWDHVHQLLGHHGCLMGVLGCTTTSPRQLSWRSSCLSSVLCLSVAIGMTALLVIEVMDVSPREGYVEPTLVPIRLVDSCVNKLPQNCWH